MMHKNDSSYGDLHRELETMKENQNQLFLMLNGAFIFSMQCGFAFLEAGSVRSKNTVNILMKNVLDLGIGAVAFWGFGYGFAYGDPGNGFIGFGQFFTSGVSIKPVVHHDHNTTFLVSDPHGFHAAWFFQYVFAATAATIVSGAMAERTQFYAYIAYSFVITGFVYPTVAHWVWSSDGWLSSGAGTGLHMQDFAGSAAVHLCGGTAAFVGSKILGPRAGRFSKTGTPKSIDGHSVASMSLGAFMLMVGFLAFNGGSKQSITESGDGAEMSLAVMNTVLGGAVSSLVATAINKIYHMYTTGLGHWSLPMAINGALIGMVSMCAGCNDIEPWAAVLIGFIAGSSFLFARLLVVKLKVDDPVDAVAVHFCGGLIGTILTPIFAIRGQSDGYGHPVGGVVYGGGVLAWSGLGWNLLGAICIILWTGSLCSVLFYALMRFGFLRIPSHVEIAGIDQHEHGDVMYPDIVIKNEQISMEFDNNRNVTSITTTTEGVNPNNLSTPPPPFEAWAKSNEAKPPGTMVD